MNRPPALTYLIGNGVSVFGIVVGSLAWLYQCWTGSAPLYTALIAIAFIVWSGNASQKIDEYANWKRARDAMNGVPPRPGIMARPASRAVLAILLVVGLGGYLALHTHELANRLALGWMVFVIIGAAFVGIVRLIARSLQRAKQRSNSKPDIVSLHASKAGAEVPTLAQAYEHLPEHCRRVMKP